MLMNDKENDRILLSRQSGFVPWTWSCLAGFIEVLSTPLFISLVHIAMCLVMLRVLTT
jgi:hypothetical protein